MRTLHFAAIGHLSVDSGHQESSSAAQAEFCGVEEEFSLDPSFSLGSPLSAKVQNLLQSMTFTS